jgi:hypothetical protein
MKRDIINLNKISINNTVNININHIEPCLPKDLQSILIGIMLGDGSLFI